ncbi:MAG: Ig-like domain-containing protein [Natrialbaceae archaeon]|nr:Ig-like domain-containing protein [Natrialbaceae archaeon]
MTLANSSIADDGTTQATVTATMSDNTTMDVTGSATYSSDDASVATVDSSGLVWASRRERQTSRRITTARVTQRW